MSDKHIKLIKPTHDGKYWAMGLVVDTLEEAFERCDRKGKSMNYFLSFGAFEVCGTKEYVQQWITK